jgi:cell division protease FtsH
VKVTIVPRGQSLGAAWYLPEERQLNSVNQILDEMCAALGGRAAEKVVFDEITTGALSDLEKVTKQAYAMVSVYGLNEAVGNLSFYDSSGNSDYNFTKPYSEKTSELIDQEVKKIIDMQYERAKQILTENRDKLDLLASQLLEKEVIFKEDLVTIFGKRLYEPEELLVPVEPTPATPPAPDGIGDTNDTNHTTDSPNAEDSIDGEEATVDTGDDKSAKDAKL